MTTVGAEDVRAADAAGLGAAALGLTAAGVGITSSGEQVGQLTPDDEVWRGVSARGFAQAAATQAAEVGLAGRAVGAAGEVVAEYARVVNEAQARAVESMRWQGWGEALMEWGEAVWRWAAQAVSAPAAASGVAAYRDGAGARDAGVAMSEDAVAVVAEAAAEVVRRLGEAAAVLRRADGEQTLAEAMEGWTVADGLLAPVTGLAGLAHGLVVEPVAAMAEFQLTEMRRSLRWLDPEYRRWAWGALADRAYRVGDVAGETAIAAWHEGEELVGAGEPGGTVQAWVDAGRGASNALDAVVDAGGELTGYALVEHGARTGDVFEIGQGLGRAVGTIGTAGATGGLHALDEATDVVGVADGTADLAAGGAATADDGAGVAGVDDLDLQLSATDLMDAERVLLAREVVSLQPLPEGSGGANEAFIARFDDGGQAIYKPTDGESFIQTRFIGGPLARREVAAYRTSRELGLDIVPTTTMAEIPGEPGTGSLQEWVEGTSGYAQTNPYTVADQDRIAVLDYVIANSDRKGDNYLTGVGGRPVALDHGLSFPRDDTRGIRSDFVAARIGEPLDPEVLAGVRAADPVRLEAALRDAGLTSRSINAALARLQEIRSRGRITGESYAGGMIDGGGNPISRPPPPTDSPGGQ
ncbi:MAG: hypothetical protein ACRCSN_12995 [Dermatophilaceae bacterium]